AAVVSRWVDRLEARLTSDRGGSTDPSAATSAHRGHPGSHPLKRTTRAFYLEWTTRVGESSVRFRRDDEASPRAWFRSVVACRRRSSRRRLWASADEDGPTSRGDASTGASPGDARALGARRRHLPRGWGAGGDRRRALRIAPGRSVARGRGP